MLENLYEEVVEIEERLVVDRNDCQLPPELKAAWKNEMTLTKEKVLVQKEPDLDVVKSALMTLKEKGIKSIAVLFLHSYS
jgi:5-oxoprolinase (ATP-hydrolysing)